ncbi:MAG: VWA domain-containing protein [Acidobacteria bacterium]|nr:VWA domain-containing protein [Acidobacteriota bacterium]
MVALKSPDMLLWVGLALVLLFIVRRWLARPSPGIFFPGADWLRRFSSRRRWVPVLLKALAGLALLCVAVAAARPYTERVRDEVVAEGVDIVLVLDISTSMSARDFQPENRLAAARDVLHDFITRRAHDRLGMITFAAAAYVLCPLTSDHLTLTALLETVELIPFEDDGTAIGLAITCAVNRLRDSHARSKVIVLLTDGINNRGEISPLQAADICRQYGIRVYTIGLGTDQETEVLARTRSGKTAWLKTRVDFDRDILEKIAERTGGRMYSAADTRSLTRIYSEIDSLEKTELEKKQVRERYDLDYWFYWLALGFLLAALLLAGVSPLSLA